MPFSVTNSPNHTNKAVPAVIVINIEVKATKLPPPKPELAITWPPTELCNMLICPHPCRKAIGIIR